MNNYDDYQLEEMENEAVNKSNNFKKAAVVGAAVLGVGGTAAYAATKLAGGEGDSLTTDDLMGVAEAGDVTEEVVENRTEEVHTNKTTVVNDKPAPAPEPEMTVDETAVVYDEDGNYIGSIDSGTYGGKSYAVYDTDGNGRGDVLAYDANGNGIYEADEFTTLDNISYGMGQGEHQAMYVQDAETGTILPVDTFIATHQHGHGYDEPIYSYEDENGEIHNDWSDMKDGEELDDLAHNNSDYNNHDEGNQYNASMGEELANNHEDVLGYGEESAYSEEETLAYEDYNDEPVDDYEDIQNDNLADDSFDSHSDMTYDEGADYMA